MLQVLQCESLMTLRSDLSSRQTSTQLCTCSLVAIVESAIGRGYAPGTRMNCDSAAVGRFVPEDVRDKRAVHFRHVDAAQFSTGPVQIPDTTDKYQQLRAINQSINQSINGGDGCRHQCASISVSYFLHFTRTQINLITTSILRSVSSSGKISCVIKNNILVNPVLCCMNKPFD